MKENPPTLTWPVENVRGRSKKLGALTNMRFLVRKIIWCVRCQSSTLVRMHSKIDQTCKGSRQKCCSPYIPRNFYQKQMKLFAVLVRFIFMFLIFPWVVLNEVQNWNKSLNGCKGCERKSCNPSMTCRKCKGSLKKAWSPYKYAIFWFWR